MSRKPGAIQVLIHLWPLSTPKRHSRPRSRGPEAAGRNCSWVGATGARLQVLTFSRRLRQYAITANMVRDITFQLSRQAQPKPNLIDI